MSGTSLPRAALAALTLLLASAIPAHGGDDAWPFGVDGPGPSLKKRDLYNLGLLGAKARDAEREAGPSFGEGVRRVSADSDGRSADLGPDRLRVEMLFPGGPAEQAGLAIGDVIVGTSKGFDGASLATLADALQKAESGKGKGVVSLRVQRGGEGKEEKVSIAIPVFGKDAKKPTEGAARQAVFERALAWLAERQDRSGGYAQTLSGTNGAVVQTSLAGLAWLAGGSDLDKGPYKENVAAAAEFVIANVGAKNGFAGRGGTSDAPAGPSWDQTNWGYAHAAIFLGELYQRSPTDAVKDALIDCGRELAERQEESGGWAHGPGGPNALGYVELNIVSGLALCGIGLAGQAGYEVPEDVVAKAEEYLSTSGSGDGGVAYSDKPGQRGMGNIGRTAGAWLGFVDLGLGKSKWGQKMGKYVRSHAGDVFGGHASWMQHVLLAGVAAHAQGGAARKAYWETCASEMTIARAPDGSFQPRPWHETISMGSNSDVNFGEVWTTAAWAIVLGCEPSDERPGLPAWMGLARM